MIENRWIILVCYGCLHNCVCLFLQVFVVKIKNFALKFSVQNEVCDICCHF